MEFDELYAPHGQPEKQVVNIAVEMCKKLFETIVVLDLERKQEVRTAPH